MLSARIKGLFCLEMTETVIGTEQKNDGGQNSPLAEENYHLCIPRARSHVPQSTSWVKLTWFLDGNGHANFQKALLKVVSTARLWGVLTVKSRKARTGWEAANGKVALNYPQEWCHLVPAPHGLLRQSKRRRLWYAVAPPPAPLMCYRWPLLYPWAVASGGGEGMEKRKKDFFV